MSDALSESSRAAEMRRARLAFLGALCDFLEQPTEERAEVMAAACVAAGSSSGHPFFAFEAMAVHGMISTLRAGSEDAWAEFLAEVIGHADARLFNRLRGLSPFKDAHIVLLRQAAQKALVASGEVGEFFSAMRDDTLVETKRFPVLDDYEDGVTLLAIRPLLLR